MGAAAGAAALQGFRVVLLAYILVVSTTAHRRWVRLLERRRYVYMYVYHPGVCVAVAAAAGSGGARYFFHYILDLDCSESRRASHAPASGESPSRECGDAACALEMSVAKVRTGVLKVCKITTASSYCMVGKLYVKWCLLLKTNNRALVRV